MLPGGVPGGQPRVEVGVLPPDKIVAIQAVLLDPKRGGLVWIVPESLGCQDHFIEKAAVSILRIHGERTAQQPDAVAEVDVAAVFVRIAAHRVETISHFDGVYDVVSAPVLAARLTHLFGGGRNHRLRMCSGNRKQ